MEELDITKLNTNKSKNIKIGELSQEIIDTLHLNLKPQNIYLWENRLMEHCKKHESEYSSHQAFVEAVECIPEILKNPDYVGIHKKCKKDPLQGLSFSCNYLVGRRTPHLFEAHLWVDSCLSILK